MLYTRANKTCQGKTWLRVRGLKLVQPYRRANKTYQGKVAEIVVHTSDHEKATKELGQGNFICGRFTSSLKDPYRILSGF